MSSTSSGHRWRFFRAGGFDQVRLDSGEDIAHLDMLDQKLWVALACPTHGLEFDAKTLDLIDTDRDGRIRAPEIIAAAQWATGMLKDPDDLLKSAPALALDTLNDATPEGKELLASAKQILINLGKSDATSITVEDTGDTARIFAQTKFNGDGILPADSAEEPALQAIIADILSCMGALTDRSGKPGIDQQRLEQFFADAAALISWHDKSTGDAAVFPLGASTAAGAATVKAVVTKIEDYFARCRLAAFDPRAQTALNLDEAQYAGIAAKNLSLTGAEFASLPLARIEAGRPLPLADSAAGINPAWRAAIDALNAQVIKPLLGEKASLTEQDWSAIVTRFAPFDAWLAAKAGAAVEKLGIDRVREIVAFKTAGGSGAKTALSDLLAKDQALAPEAAAIDRVERLVRYHRDLFKLLNNFVAFRDFYSRREKAIFQAGTLYLDQRSCELCMRVEDPARHASMAHLSYAYLAYCDLTRRPPPAVPGKVPPAPEPAEKMAVVCAFTAGDSDNLMVGRNGIFYDRQGRDWDATISKIVENPISIRQAFWSPYKRFARWIEDQVAKRAAAADAASHNRLTTTSTDFAGTVTAPPPAAPAAPPAQRKIDVGVVAALGVAVGALSTAFGILLNWLSGTPPYFLPMYIFIIILLISLPSMILAALKLRQRNLGPILDANGWAINARARINIPFGRSLTHTPKLPPGSQHDMFDPFAESHATRNGIIAILILVLALFTCWYFGLVEKVLPNFPMSPYMKRVADNKAKADAAIHANVATVAPGAETQPTTKP